MFSMMVQSTPAHRFDPIRVLRDAIGSKLTWNSWVCHLHFDKVYIVHFNLPNRVVLYYIVHFCTGVYSD